MDLTPLFKAHVKSVKTRNKAFGVQNDGGKNRILKTKPKLKNGFSSSARDVTSQITRLRDFLLESRDPYLSFFNVSSRDEMTDSDRDQIENAAQKIINNCSLLVKEFKLESKKVSASPQTRDYMDGVIELIENYLKAVCKIFSEFKALRVRRALEVRQLSRLELPREKALKLMEQHSELEDSEPDTVDGDITSVNRVKSKLNVSEIDNALNQDLVLSSEELQMFESENVQLFNELNSLSEEVKQIESKVLHIAELQEVFTEKVLQQEQDIDRISNVVVGATENVTGANEQIKQAIQRNAGLRVWILFFLLVMSFSLLFLDWYND